MYPASLRSGSLCRRLRRLALGVPATLLAVLAAGCGGPPAPKKANRTAEVVVTRPITDEVTDYQDFTGRLTAIKTVEIKARVSGYVKTVNFKEGDVVREGDLLFDIDPFTYAADLKQAEANLRLAEADANLQQKLARRAEDLYARKAMSREDYETAQATYEKSLANVGSVKAARDKAKLYVDYLKVRAPVTGRISYRYVDPGNLVVADSTLLTTIVTEDPLYAYFDVDERTFVELAGPSSKGKTSWFLKLHFPVLMRLATEDEFTHVGTTDFLDNRVNASTGTIRMRGVFKNDQGYLKSGLFVRIRLPVGQPYPALLVPDEALQSDQGRKFLYVVTPKNTVEYRRVTLGQAVKGLRVIATGLKAGERVVITGQQRVRQGAQVKVKEKAPPPRPRSALTRLLAQYRVKTAPQAVARKE